MQEFPKCWDLRTKINFLQRKILLNSILYYEYNKNKISDHFYDELCEQLVKLQEEYSMNNDILDTMYGYVYYDFDGSTGYHLYNRLTNEDKKILDVITIVNLMKK